MIAFKVVFGYNGLDLRKKDRYPSHALTSRLSSFELRLEERSDGEESPDRIRVRIGV